MRRYKQSLMLSTERAQQDPDGYQTRRWVSLSAPAACRSNSGARYLPSLVSSTWRWRPRWRAVINGSLTLSSPWRLSHVSASDLQLPSSAGGSDMLPSDETLWKFTHNACGYSGLLLEMRYANSVRTCQSGLYGSEPSNRTALTWKF